MPYCVCYDVADGAITALRAYLPINLMVARVRAAADRVASLGSVRRVHSPHYFQPTHNH